MQRIRTALRLESPDGKFIAQIGDSLDQVSTPLVTFRTKSIQETLETLIQAGLLNHNVVAVTEDIEED